MKKLLILMTLSLINQCSLQGAYNRYTKHQPAILEQHLLELHYAGTLDRTITHDLIDAIRNKTINLDEIASLIAMTESSHQHQPAPKKTLQQAHAPRIRTELPGYGLENFSGVNCYSNAVMQCIRQLPLFKTFYLSIVEHMPHNGPASLDQEFSYILDNTTGNTAINPGFFSNEAIARIFPWDRQPDGSIHYQQNDAQEYFNGLINNILPHDQRRNNIKQLFEYTLSSTVRCNRCHNQSTRREQTTALSLPIDTHAHRNDINGCINNYQRVENLTDNNRYNCQRCGFYVDAQRLTTIEQTPDIAVVHLNRFAYNRKTHQREKLLTTVAFPTNNFRIITHSNDFYDLSGIVLHSGTAQSGHYTALVHDYDNNRWLYCNDSTVNIVSNEQVEQCGRSGLFNQTFTPYLLFYRKV